MFDQTAEKHEDVLENCVEGVVVGEFEKTGHLVDVNGVCAEFGFVEFAEFSEGVKAYG